MNLQTRINQLSPELKEKLLSDVVKQKVAERNKMGWAKINDVLESWFSDGFRAESFETERLKLINKKCTKHQQGDDSYCRSCWENLIYKTLFRIRFHIQDPGFWQKKLSLLP